MLAALGRGCARDALGRGRAPPRTRRAAAPHAAAAPEPAGGPAACCRTQTLRPHPSGRAPASRPGAGSRQPRAWRWAGDLRGGHPLGAGIPLGAGPLGAEAGCVFRWARVPRPRWPCWAANWAPGIGRREDFHIHVCGSAPGSGTLFSPLATLPRGGCAWNQLYPTWFPRGREPVCGGWAVLSEAGTVALCLRGFHRGPDPWDLVAGRVSSPHSGARSSTL